MSTDNGNGTGVNGAGGAVVHLVLQGKGGIGKSVIASWLAEYLLKRGENVRCIDGDPVNRSLTQYKFLNAEKLDLINEEGLIVRMRYDALLERFASEHGAFVVDSGSTAFLPLWSYIVETEVVRVLREAGRKLYVHCVVSGGEMLSDSLLGFDTLAKSTPDRNVVVWVNEYFGPVAREGKTFDQMNVFQKHADKVLGSIGIPQRSPDTFGATVLLMREKKLTFDEAMDSNQFMLAQKSRLHIVRRDLYEQLDKLELAR
jgi:CobQ/CobB/MinD/ParA family nucleotide binding protein